MSLLLAVAIAIGASAAKVKSTVWTGEVAMGNWSGYVVLTAEQTSSFETGDQLLVTVKDLDNSGTPMVYLQNSGWTDFTPSVKTTLTAAGTVSFTLTEEMMAEIAGKGMVVKGCYATLTKIALQKEVELGDNDSDLDAAFTEVWSGEQKISWEEPGKAWATIPASAFANLKEGNLLHFDIDAVQPGAQARIVSASWQGFDGAPIKNVSVPYYEYEVNGDMLAEIMANGLVISGNGYTLTSISIVDQTPLPKTAAEVDLSGIKAYERGEKPTIAVEVQNLEGSAKNIVVKALVYTDMLEQVGEAVQIAATEAGGTGSVDLALEDLQPGVYNIVVLANERIVGSYNIAYALTSIKSEPDAKADFMTFWTDAVNQLASIEPDYKLTELPEKSGSKRKIYLVEMSSVPDGASGNPVTIRGYYAEPIAEGKHPVIITYQGYDSAQYGPDGKPTDPYCPDGNSGDWAEFILSTRGQSINNRQPYENTYGDWFAFNFGNKDSYYYRGAYMDALRAIDFVASRENVDKDNIFAQGQSQGGALTIAAAALDPQKRLKAIAPAVPFMGDFPDYFKRASWPRSVAVKEAADKGLTDAQMYEFLSYFDTKNLAPYIECPAIQAIGLQDNICPPHTNMAPYNNLKVDNRKLIVNPLNAHSVPSTWQSQYMEWFNKAIEGMPEYIELTTKIFTGPMEVNWSAVTLGNELFKGVKNGDRLRVTLSAIAEERTKWPQLRITDKSGALLWESLPLYDDTKGLPAPFVKEYEIDATIAATLLAGGCKINGCGFTLASVDLIGKEEISTIEKHPELAQREIWSGSEKISWASDDTKNSVLIDKSKFSDMKAGNTVRVSMSSVANNAQLRLQANYTQFEPVSNTQLKGSTSCDIVFDQAMVDLVKSKGLRCTGCYYTLEKVEIIDPAQAVNSRDIISTACVKAWEDGESPMATVNIQSLEAHDYAIPVTVTLFEDVNPSEPLTTIEKDIAMKAKELTVANIPLGALAPGFYSMQVKVNGALAGSYTIGSNPTAIIVEYDGQPDFDDFWDAALAELATVEPEYTFVKEMTDYSTSSRKVWYVEMKSVADTRGGVPVTISGYYAEPVAEGSYPVLVHFQGTDGGTSTPWCISGDSNPGWCEFVLSVRGQMLNNRDPYADRNIYTLNGMSYYTFGLANDDYKREHYYYGAYLDCVRAIDFVASREKADSRYIFCEGGSQGGAFTYVAAALAHDRVCAAAPGITGHADFPVDFKVAAWPANQILPLAAANGISESGMLERLSYFDVKNFAHLVTCPVTTNLSLQHTTDPPHVGFAPFNLLDVAEKEYLVNPLLGHATAPDWQKRYMEFFNKRISDSQGIGDVSAAGAPEIYVDGGCVCSSTGAPIRVYDLAGCLVAQGASPLRLPAPGLYIAASGTATVKIAVR